MSDHQDAHLAKLHPECDIGDFWAYRSGTGAEARIVLVMTLNAGNIGRVHYGPRGNRNQHLVTTVPKRFLGYLDEDHQKEAKSNGLMVRADIRRELTRYLRFHPDAVYEFRFAMDKASPRAAVSFKVVFEGAGGVRGSTSVPQTITVLKAVAADGDHVERGDRSGTRVDFAGQPRTYTGDDPQDIGSVSGFHSGPRPDGGRIQVFAGPRMDPFIFDFEGQNSPVAYQYRRELCLSGAPSGGRSDAFSRAFNISAIVLEIPVLEILSKEEADANREFYVWSATTLDGHPINRAGWPLFKPTFLPKEYFDAVLDPTNATHWADQKRAMAPLLRENFQRLGVHPSLWDELIEQALPDALPIRVCDPVGLQHENGRELTIGGDPAVYWIGRLDTPYTPPSRPNPYTPHDVFPYLRAPSAEAATDGWQDYLPIPDPAWPAHPGRRTGCDDFQLSREDPTDRHAGQRPMTVP